MSDILFIGYAEADLGLGQSFRSTLLALEAAGMNFSVYPFNKNVENRRIGPFLAKHYDFEGMYDINVIYMATDQLPFYFEALAQQSSCANYKILRTFWELPEAPREWTSLLERIDELWVPNFFVLKAFRPIFDGRITIIPECVNISRGVTLSRVDFGLAEKCFYVLYSFDYYSFTARKNPAAVLRVFQNAFPSLDSNVGLVIKTTGVRELDATVATVLSNAELADPRVKVVNGFMSRDEIVSLIDCCDCYMSLHRSEGFGLGMAEAMALDKPVIGTGFSGNTDFLTTFTGFPVAFTKRPLQAGEYHFGDGQYWAEPDLQDAVRQLRYIADHAADRQRRGYAGGEFVRSLYSHERLASAIQHRLDEIRADRNCSPPAAN